MEPHGTGWNRLKGKNKGKLLPPLKPIEGAKRGLDIPQDSRKPPPTGQGLSCRTEGGTPASLVRPLGDGQGPGKKPAPFL